MSGEKIFKKYHYMENKLDSDVKDQTKKALSEEIDISE